MPERPEIPEDIKHFLGLLARTLEQGLSLQQKEYVLREGEEKVAVSTPQSLRDIYRVLVFAYETSGDLDYAMRVYRRLAGIKDFYSDVSIWMTQLASMASDQELGKTAQRSRDMEQSINTPATATVGQQIFRIHNAILDAYNRDELRRVVRSCMNEDFDHHVAADKTYADQVFDFIEWANRQGRLLELVQCAAEGNRRNAGVQALWTEAQTWRILGSPASPSGQATPPAAPHQVFLAFSHEDKDTMNTLRAELLAAGIVVWIAEDDLEPGTPVWQRAIEHAIRESKCVLVILSPHAKGSEWVNIEITFARSIKRRVFPILASGDEDSAIPIILVATQWIDLRKDLVGGMRGKVIPTLRRYLGL